MEKPSLRAGSEILLLPYPTDFEVNHLTEQDEQTTLNGNVLTDIRYIKYSLNISYDAIKRVDYEAIRDFIVDALTDKLDLEFRYEKVNLFDSYKKVVVRLPSARFIGGSGSSDYYYSLKITLVDKEKR